MNLYLDTARMGRFCDAARFAVTDFIAFQSDEGSSAHFDDFLSHGYAALPSNFRSRYPGLRQWHGVDALTASLQALVGLRRHRRTFVASSSGQMMRLAAKSLFSRCHNVLIPDVTWPEYTKRIEYEGKRSGRCVTQLDIGNWITSDKMTAADLIGRMVAHYSRHRCDGLFIPAVTNHGIRLPVAEIVAALRAELEPKFVVVDGAQEFCHVPLNLNLEYCDIYLTGSHKWLEAYLPMRMAFCCRPSSQELVESVCRTMMRDREIDDALLHFVQQLRRREVDPFAGTADLAPLFACAGAASDLLTVRGSQFEAFEVQITNAELIANLASQAAWHPILPDKAFRSGIMLLQPKQPHVAAMSTEQLRRGFRLLGISLTVYEKGIIRLSMPKTGLKADENGLIQLALQNRERYATKSILRRHEPVTMP